MLADPEYGFSKPMIKEDLLQVWFSFNGLYPKSQSDFILRRMIVVIPPEGKKLEEIIRDRKSRR